MLDLGGTTMLRYSLRTLGLAIGLIAASVAALLNPNPWVSSAAWTMMFALLSLATITAVLNRAGFWTG